MNEARPVIRCRGLAKTFAEGPIRAEVLKSVALDVAPGETVAIVGASGAGKSTLLHLLGGLDLPSAGEIEVDGVAISALGDRARGALRNRALGFVYQFHHLLPEFTALENVAMPLLIAGRPIDEALARARAARARRAPAPVQHKPGELSGGERQRAAVARALVTRRPACWRTSRPGTSTRRNAATCSR
jgi:lipoprotein-releasing system ATP-binding protein